MEKSLRRINKIQAQLSEELGNLFPNRSFEQLPLTITTDLGICSITGPQLYRDSGLYVNSEDADEKEVLILKSSSKITRGRNIPFQEEIISDEVSFRAAISGSIKTNSKGEAIIELMDFILYSKKNILQPESIVVRPKHFAWHGLSRLYFYFTETPPFYITLGGEGIGDPVVFTYQVEFDPPSIIDQIKEGFLAAEIEESTVERIWPEIRFPVIKIKSWRMNGDPAPNRTCSWNCITEVKPFVKTRREQ